MAAFGVQAMLTEATKAANSSAALEFAEFALGFQQEFRGMVNDARARALSERIVQMAQAEATDPPDLYAACIFLLALFSARQHNPPAAATAFGEMLLSITASIIASRETKP